MSPFSQMQAEIQAIEYSDPRWEVVWGSGFGLGEGLRRKWVSVVCSALAT